MFRGSPRDRTQMPSVGTILSRLVAVAALAVTARGLTANTEPPVTFRGIVQVRTLAAFPKDVTAAMGWHSQGGDDAISDLNEKPGTKDSTLGLPRRRFILGGASSSAALIAYEESGHSPSFHVVGFALGVSGWQKVGEWTLDSGELPGGEI
jgi:hypothetical protein